MTSRRRNKFDRRHSGPLFITALLASLGVIDLIATPVGVLIVLGLRVNYEEPVDVTFVALLAGAFVAGVALGGLLLGLAALLRYGHALARARDPDFADRHDTDLAEGYHAQEGTAAHRLFEADPSAHPHGDAAARASWHLADAPDLAVLDPEEREPARERILANLQRRAAEQVIDAINARMLGRARLLLRDAEAYFPAAPTLEKLKERVEQAATRNEALDYARTKRLVAEAVSDGQWGLAERHAHALTFDHPDSSRCRQLWDNTRRARLRSHIQRCAELHHWAEALAASEEFLERFPEGAEAEALREQVDTLRANVEIQQRKQYESRFKELLQTHQYVDALRIAKRVVDRFPESPQAHALRDQIPLLEKRAAG